MSAANVAVLLLRVADVTCAVPAAHVQETMRPLPVTAVDGMPTFVRGVATIRGAATPVLDLGVLLGRHGNGVTRFVTVHAAGRVVALAVDEVLGMSSFTAEDFHARPPLLAAGAPPLVEALARKDAALYLLLDTTRLIDAAEAAP